MQVSIDEIEGPQELTERSPVVADLLREMPGKDRPDYWLARLATPLPAPPGPDVTHIILATRWAGTAIEPGMADVLVGIAYVTDASLLNDRELTFSKSRYVAIGTATDTSAGTPRTPS